MNPKKCRVKCTQISFFGLIVGRQGIAPDPKKVNAITTLKPTKNTKELQSILGLANYLSRFSPYITEITVPLRALLKKETSFVWFLKHQ